MMIALALLAAASAAPQTEMALRCTTVDSAPLLVRNAATFPGTLSGGPAPAPVSKPLPQMMVEGWSTSDMPVDKALGQLAGDAGFTVEADPGLAPVSWKGETAPLATVVSKLAQSAGGVASFDGKVLHVSRPRPAEPWRMQRPAGRDAVLALLDALRGYGATAVSLGSDAVTFEATPAVVARIRRGLTASTSVVAFDVWSYRVKTRSPVDWNGIDEIAPVLERHPDAAGVRYAVGYVEPEKVSAFLGRFGEVSEFGRQTVAGPQGWALDVPLTQCATVAAKATSAMVKPAWSGKDMSVEIAGPDLGSGRIGAVSPGSSAIAAGPVRDGYMTVAVMRPRVLVAR